MSKDRFLTGKDIEENILKLKKFMKAQKLDSFYVPTNDIFLNEYVPLHDCHRYYVTNFTGSTGEALIPLNGKVILFVDGRYYEQADLEVDPNLVEVYKCPYGMSIKSAIMETIHDRGLKFLGVEGDRIDLSLYNEFRKKMDVKSFNNGELAGVIDFQSVNSIKEICELSIDIVGESTLSKCQRLLKPGEAFFITALDSIAWISNLRRFEMPYQCTFKAKALATHERLYLFVEDFEGNIECPDIEIMTGSFSKLETFLETVTEYETIWKKFLGMEPQKIEKVFLCDSSINAADFHKLKNHFKQELLVSAPEGLVPYHASKNTSEQKAMAQAFNRGDQAIFETILWVKDQIREGAPLTELDFYHKANEFYKNNGCLEQSFKTIAAVGANSSIIHYSNPSSDVVMKNDELVLLDSGGYFESGYATDTTRSFLSGGMASARQKEIYTVVLKALLNIQNAVFPEGTWGSLVDGLARQPVFKYGLNYNHGTGHGIGINVHEGGFRLSTTSNVPLKENVAGSIEPGIYIPGFGGVRLENIVVVEKHPEIFGMLHFRPLVYIGFDHDLIDQSLLSLEEQAWLEAYERECQARGRSFKYRN